MTKLIKPSPNKLWIAITNACNLRCPYCLIKSGDKFENELSTKEIRRIIKEAINLGVQRIAFTGGEPLLRSDILNLIQYSASFKIRTYLETNGIFLTKKLIYKLKKYGLEVLNLSLDGSDSTTFDKIRQRNGIFKKTISVIKEATRVGLDVRVYCTVTNENIKNVKKMPILFVNLPQKIRVLTYAYFTPLGRGEDKNKLTVPPKQWKNFCEELDKLIILYKNKVVIRYEPVFVTRINFRKLQSSLPYDVSCLARERDWIYVSPVGDVYGCVLLVNSNIKLGNIRNQKLSDIWMNSHNWSFFNPINTGNKQCYNGGCRALAFRIKNDMSSPDPKCDKLDKNLIPICPLTQYPKIEKWPNEHKRFFK